AATSPGLRPPTENEHRRRLLAWLGYLREQEPGQGRNHTPVNRHMGAAASRRTSRARRAGEERALRFLAGGGGAAPRPGSSGGAEPAAGARPSNGVWT